jgi:hypothetical protein
MLSRKRRRLRAYADDDLPFVVQDLDLPTPFALELRHAENAAPNCFKVGGEMTFAPQPRAVSANQAEFIVRHGFPSPRSLARKTLDKNEGSAPDEIFSRLLSGPKSLQDIDAPTAGVGPDFRSAGPRFRHFSL